MSNTIAHTPTPNEVWLKQILRDLDGTAAENDAWKVLFSYRQHALSLAMSIISHQSRLDAIERLRGVAITELLAIAKSKGVPLV